MCGICGYFNIGSSSGRYRIKDINVMNQELSHRGPDAEGSYQDAEGVVGLGHRRLSIVDLSDNANQPMCNESKNIWVSFNGEIYNSIELRNRINFLGEGHIWKTDHSDTEVIIHAYEEWGIEFIHLLRGVYAIAIWDEQIRTLYLIRDRMGVKPLYYTWESNLGLLFASEIKAIIKVKRTPNKINHTALQDYLSYGYTCEQSLFDQVMKVLPGNFIKVNSQGVSCHRYWRLWEHIRKDIFLANEKEVPDIILKELQNAVRIRRMADVPVGIFLSGGVDSSTIARLYKDDSNNVAGAFCIGYREKGLSYQNENEYAKQVAKLINTKFYEKNMVQDDIYSVMDDIVYSLDEPNSDPTCVCQYYVANLARSYGIKVAMSGEGADELFWGYEHWKGALKRENLLNSKIGHIISPMSIKLAEGLGYESTYTYEWLQNSSKRRPIYRGQAAGFFTRKMIREMLMPDIQKELSAYDSYTYVERLYEEFKKEAMEKSALNWMTYINLMHRLPEDYLMRVDKMTMAVGLECRVPFLDHEFVEIAMSIPAKYKIRDNENKIILKKAVQEILPENIVWRKKQGFTLPIQDWLKQGLGDKIDEEIKKFCNHTGVLDYSKVKYIIDMNTFDAKWNLYALALWGNRYFG